MTNHIPTIAVDDLPVSAFDVEHITCRTTQEERASAQRVLAERRLHEAEFFGGLRHALSAE